MTIIVFIVIITIGLFYIFRKVDWAGFLRMTPIERRMYLALFVMGHNPIPQYPVCGYRLDFAIIRGALKIDIECDGASYHSTPEQKRHDRKRTRILNKNGWKVIRFSGKQIYKDILGCVLQINRRIS